MTSRRTWWLVYALGSFLIVAALGWVTIVLLKLERAVVVESRQQEATRLALWRMDSWLAPQLAREAARPYFEYLPYYPQERAYTRYLNRIDAGEVLAPSPLLVLNSDFILIHLQICDDGAVLSPQAPTGNQRDLVEAVCTTGAAIDAKAALLARAVARINPREIATRLEQAEAAMGALAAATVSTPTVIAPSAGDQRTAPPQQQATAMQRNDELQKAMTQKEYAARAFSSNMAQQQVFEAPNLAGTVNDAMREELSSTAEHVMVGPLVPIWLDGAEAGTSPELAFLRRVRVAETSCVQGFLVDWSRLERALLDRIADLFPAAALEPVPESPGADASTERLGLMLATIPATLRIETPLAVSIPLITPARAALALAWLAVGGAIAASGLTLRASIAFGQKRSRFASAVTHELRTPLTTFRMYSDMLAEGMVPTEPQRREYLRTLQRESARLSGLVENVLSYARLEQGRPQLRAQRMTVLELMDRVRPNLEERAAEANMTLAISIAADSDAPLSVDADAVGQILQNLVDNACKYAADATDRRIHLDATAARQRVEIRVRDHGPGVPPASARAIFQAFERGAHRAGDATPGLGLGLSLAREWARALGGDLHLETAPDGGACFCLTIESPRDARALRFRPLKQ